MNKEVVVEFYDDETYKRFDLRLSKNYVSFKNQFNGYSVVIPIEVFYQMWDSPEMCHHMEDYYHMSKNDNA